MAAALNPPVHLSSVTRESVRAFVTSECQALRDVAAAGANVHQYQLDRQDQIAAFAATLAHGDALSFWTLYAEEMNAASATMLDDAAALNATAADALMRNATQAGQAGTWVALAMFFIGIIIMVSFLRH